MNEPALKAIIPSFDRRVPLASLVEELLIFLMYKELS